MQPGGVDLREDFGRDKPLIFLRNCKPLGVTADKGVERGLQVRPLLRTLQVKPERHCPGPTTGRQAAPLSRISMPERPPYLKSSESDAVAMDKVQLHRTGMLTQNGQREDKTPEHWLGRVCDQVFTPHTGRRGIGIGAAAGSGCCSPRFAPRRIHHLWAAAPDPRIRARPGDSSDAHGNGSDAPTRDGLSATRPGRLSHPCTSAFWHRERQRSAPRAGPLPPP